MRSMNRFFKGSFVLIILFISFAYADDGYRLWLKYDVFTNPHILNTYNDIVARKYIIGNSETIQIINDELDAAIEGMLGDPIESINRIEDKTLIVGCIEDLPKEIRIQLKEESQLPGEESYLIKTLQKNNAIIISAKTDRGLLYGVFKFISLIQREQEINDLNIASSPKIKLRLLNHWDNLDRTVERGYAGFSLWDWHKLPDYIHPYYIDYARANASVGINGTVLNNVNANAQILTPLYLAKVKALADVFRPYGLKVYLSVKFSAPIDIGGLKISDPLNQEVRNWWKKKVAEIYETIPDFGGFLVKANSEGQPGPGDYGRTHADGANMLAVALEPFGGIVMWRAFVYDHNNKEDRAKQAYHEFKPLDGKFCDNVLVQVKNGAIDFQPREPFHPLFGATPHTPLMMEFQITQEYLGFGTHLIYLGTLFEEVLQADTYQKGKGSVVARVIDGSLHQNQITGIAGVANTGTDRNWTGHLFGQANWYAFGQLAWDPYKSSEKIAEEWIQLTLSHNEKVIQTIMQIMMNSRENLVNYMTPLGLHHIMGWSHHYGPGPWIKDKHRDDWTSVYYHKADKEGIGFNRTKTGSNAVSQYAKPVAEQFGSLKDCPEEFLLWFHHVNWNYRLKSQNTLWEELCYRYYDGAMQVVHTQNLWNSLKNDIDPEIFDHVRQMLNIQAKEAVWWRDACLLYFQTFSQLPIPDKLSNPLKTLDYYIELNFPYAPK